MSCKESDMTQQLNSNITIYWFCFYPLGWYVITLHLFYFLYFSCLCYNYLKYFLSIHLEAHQTIITLLHPLVNSRKKGSLLPVFKLTCSSFLPHVPGVLLLLSSFCFENCLIHSFRVHLSMTNSLSVTLSETVSILSPFLMDIFCWI